MHSKKLTLLSGHKHHCLCLLLAMLLTSLPALAEHGSAHPGDIIPGVASTIDTVSVMVGLQRCPHEQVDPEQQPTLVSLGDGYFRLTYHTEYETDPAVTFCPAVVQPPEVVAIPLGTIASGYHGIQVVGKKSHGIADETWSTSFIVNDFPGPSVSGAWFSPQQSGRGIFVQRFSNDTETTFAVYWANHDAAGDPSWAVASGPMIDNVLETSAFQTHGTPLAPGAADLELIPWGSIRLEYTSCQHMTLSWDADDAAIEDGSQEQIQLARPDGLPECSTDDYATPFLPTGFIVE